MRYPGKAERRQAEFRVRDVRVECWGGGIPDAMRPDGMAAGGISGCGGRPGGMAEGGIPDVGASRWNVSGGAGGIPGAMCPDGMAAGEFWMQYASGWSVSGGEIPDAMRPDGINMVVSSMKNGYGLYGDGGLGEWF